MITIEEDFNSPFLWQLRNKNILIDANVDPTKPEFQFGSYTGFDIVEVFTNFNPTRPYNREVVVTRDDIIGFSSDALMATRIDNGNKEDTIYVVRAIRYPPGSDPDLKFFGPVSNKLRELGCVIPKNPFLAGRLLVVVEHIPYVDVAENGSSGYPSKISNILLTIGKPPIAKRDVRISPDSQRNLGNSHQVYIVDNKTPGTSYYYKLFGKIFELKSAKDPSKFDGVYVKAYYEDIPIYTPGNKELLVFHQKLGLYKVPAECIIDLDTLRTMADVYKEKGKIAQAELSLLSDRQQFDHELILNNSKLQLENAKLNTQLAKNNTASNEVADRLTVKAGEGIISEAFKILGRLFW